MQNWSMCATHKNTWRHAINAKISVIRLEIKWNKFLFQVQYQWIHGTQLNTKNVDKCVESTMLITHRSSCIKHSYECREENAEPMVDAARKFYFKRLTLVFNWFSSQSIHVSMQNKISCFCTHRNSFNRSISNRSTMF